MSSQYNNYFKNWDKCEEGFIRSIVIKINYEVNEHSKLYSMIFTVALKTNRLKIIFLLFVVGKLIQPVFIICCIIINLIL